MIFFISHVVAIAVVIAAAFVTLVITDLHAIVYFYVVFVAVITAAVFVEIAVVFVVVLSAA